MSINEVFLILNTKFIDLAVFLSSSIEMIFYKTFR